MKKTQLEKAIDAIESEIAVLVAARERLQKQQQASAPKRKPKDKVTEYPAVARDVAHR